MPIVGAGCKRKLAWAELCPCNLSGRRLEGLGSRTEKEGAIDITGPSKEIAISGHHGHCPVVNGFNQTRAGLSG
jgi:hypothetical protein